MRRKKTITQSIIILLISVFMFGLGHGHTIDNVVITPEMPGPGDDIVITVKGTFLDGCERETSTLVTRMDNEILLQIFTVPTEGSCPLVITQFESNETIGPLGEGVFNLTTILYEGTPCLDEGATLHDYDKTTIGEEPLEIMIFITPRTINLKRQGRYIKCLIRMPLEHNVDKIDTTSLLLDDTVSPVNVKTGDVMIVAVFDTKELTDILEPGDSVEITLTGKLTDGVPFTATDTVRVINPGK